MIVFVLLLQVHIATDSIKSVFDRLKGLNKSSKKARNHHSCQLCKAQSLGQRPPKPRERGQDVCRQVSVSSDSSNAESLTCQLKWTNNLEDQCGGWIINNDNHWSSRWHHNMQCECVRAKSLQSCTTLFNPIDCSPPGSSVHGILQQEYWSGLHDSSKGSSWPRDQTQISLVSWIGRQFLYH